MQRINSGKTSNNTNSYLLTRWVESETGEEISTCEPPKRVQPALILSMICTAGAGAPPEPQRACEAATTPGLLPLPSAVGELPGLISTVSPSEQFCSLTICSVA